MSHLVLRKIRARSKVLVTLLTEERLSSGVDPLMTDQVANLTKGLIALVTLIGFYFVMSPLMLLH